MSIADNVTPTTLENYLRVSGWTSERNNERRSIWRHAGGLRVFVPSEPGSDFDELISLALTRIAEAEHRDLKEILLSVAWSQFDKLYVSRDAATSALPFADGIDLHNALHDVIEASALAATERRPTFIGRRPLRVENYLDQVSLIPAEAGSFVVRTLLPLHLPGEAEQLPMVGPADPQVREISELILAATRSAVFAATDVFAGSSMDRWNDAVAAGVSSNLCDAMARLVGVGNESGSSARLRIDWTWAAPASASDVVVVPSGMAPVLAAGADFLRGSPEEHSVFVTGLVTKLHRDEAMGPGEVTVRGLVDGTDSSPRSVRVELDEQTYREAISAHDQGKSVRVAALVQRTKGRLLIIRGEDFHVLG